jgi:hypothetical protein
MDVNIALLNDDLDKEVYMKLLEGLVINGQEKKKSVNFQIII